MFNQKRIDQNVNPWRKSPALPGGVLMGVIALATCMLASGCGTQLQTVLSDFGVLPSASQVSQPVRTACDGVMTETQMLTEILSARFDLSNGYTRSEEEVSAFTGCTLDSIGADFTFDECTTCKSAILDQVYGN
jgi:hypothetical protein